MIQLYDHVFSIILNYHDNGTDGHELMACIQIVMRPFQTKYGKAFYIVLSQGSSADWHKLTLMMTFYGFLFIVRHREP